MEFKGTKEEWKYSIHNGKIIFNKPNMDLWFHDEGNNFKEEPKEVLANAKLIAAAPDMLEALQKIAANSNDHAMIRIAIKAIQKAIK